MDAFRIEHLNFTYPGQESPACADLSLCIPKGGFWVFCGASGCGKTTLLRQLKPCLAPNGTRSGEIFFFGQPLAAWPESALAAKIGFVMQSPDAQTVTDKVWHELAFGLESLGTDSETVRRRCAETAAFFGIDSWMHRAVSELSGGQKQLLALASVTVMQPEVLILDEPTAQLDPIAASEFIAMLGKINRELGTTVLLSEHHLEEVCAYADTVAVLSGGRLLCSGPVQTVGQKLKDEQRALFAAMPCAMRVWGAAETALPCPVTVNEGRTFLHEYTKTHPLLPMPEHAKPDFSGETVLSAREISFRYERHAPDVLRALDFSAQAGTLTCILGGNGAGKSTFLRALCGILSPQRGEVEAKGKTVLLPQDPKSVFYCNSVYEDLAEALRMNGADEKSLDARIAEVASLCRITALLARHPFDLSGGEQQRAALAKLLLTEPDILLLDEPTKGLDVPFQAEFAAILRLLKAKGVCIVAVSHDIPFCARYADRCGLFFDGHLTALSETRAFFCGNRFYTTAAHRMAQELLPEAVLAEDVIAAIGGRLPEPPVTEHTGKRSAHSQMEQEPTLPLWRRIAAAGCGLGAFGVLCAAAKTNAVRAAVQNGDLRQFAWYGAILLLLLAAAMLLGHRQNAHEPMPHSRMSRRTVLATVLIVCLIPLTLYFGYFHSAKYTYLTALAVLLEAMLPFFVIFEGRKPSARELVLLSALCAMAIAGRAAFFMLPQFKPVAAFVILAGVAFGGESGFLVGSVTMLISNLLFSQGPWTPFQMFAMGLIGWLAGVLSHLGWLAPKRLPLCVYGALSVTVIYGGLMNPAAALLWGNEALNLKILLTYYIAGFPMDLIHAAATVLFLWFGAEPLLRKLTRIRRKYG